MADNERSQGRAEIWPEETQAGRVAAGLDIACLFGPVTERLAGWLAAELGPGRLMPWMPVAFGAGIAVYFTAEREPTWWAPTVPTAALALALALAAVMAHRRPLAFALTISAAMMAAGFTTATLRTAALVHPVLR